MNKKIFNIGRLFSILAMVTLMLTACEKDDKSNPAFKATSPSFKLNVPANATNNVYDLVSANGLELTCTQPDYNGVPYVTQYHVQIALSEDFSQFKELPAWGLYIRHAENITLKNVTLTAKEKEYRPAIVADDVTTLKLEKINISEPDSKNKKQIIKNNVRK